MSRLPACPIELEKATNLVAFSMIPKAMLKEVRSVS
jgi:hypothetical protein